MLQDGYSGAEISRALGVSPSTVSRHAIALGYRASDRRCQFDWPSIRAYYDAGHTMTECQLRFGFSRGAWDAAVSRGDVVPRRDRESRAPGPTRRAVAQLLADGMSHAEIARRLEVTPATVS